MWQQADIWTWIKSESQLCKYLGKNIPDEGNIQGKDLEMDW